MKPAGNMQFYSNISQNDHFLVLQSWVLQAWIAHVVRYTATYLGLSNVEAFVSLMTFILQVFLKCGLCSMATVTVLSLSPVASECECHGHSNSCQFSQRAWHSSGGTSGGVCDDCQHHTAGRRCQRCRQGYHRHPSRLITSPHTCTRKRHGLICHYGSWFLSVVKGEHI